jgi:hypothetical protein
MAAGEREILAREGALKAAARGGATHTTYTYATGSDGRKYIVGAEVSVTAPEDVLEAMPGGSGVSRPAGLSLSPGENRDVRPDNPSETNRADDENIGVIAEMERIESKVIAHETAHKAAAGQFGGPVSYTYETGPDGKRYISGGSVPVHTPATSDPEEALRNANQILRAALAPDGPSGQDLAVAAASARSAANARARIAAENSNPAESSDPSKHRPERGDAGSISSISKNIENDGSDHGTEFNQVIEAYSRQASPKGLWTSSYGFENPLENEVPLSRTDGASPSETNPASEAAAVTPGEQAADRRRGIWPGRELEIAA